MFKAFKKKKKLMHYDILTVLRAKARIASNSVFFFFASSYLSFCHFNPCKETKNKVRISAKYLGEHDTCLPIKPNSGN